MISFCGVGFFHVVLLSCLQDHLILVFGMHPVLDGINMVYFIIINSFLDYVILMNNEYV